MRCKNRILNFKFSLIIDNVGGTGVKASKEEGGRLHSCGCSWISRCVISCHFGIICSFSLIFKTLSENVLIRNSHYCSKALQVRCLWGPTYASVPESSPGLQLY